MAFNKVPPEKKGTAPASQDSSSIAHLPRLDEEEFEVEEVGGKSVDDEYYVERSDHETELVPDNERPLNIN
ncbi:hypothetical protein LAZ67_2007013 [Cordylochernes scorpioides]|uniref:Uncharacterized protein n=1 Tax=Cordylochernes scorpioides TaxID=51811 RepID=A0ABY6K6I5_9ARAC|nr:hypothetical protein LAZ67_2007013 [Cordylochernes scorpioides]